MVEADLTVLGLYDALFPDFDLKVDSPIKDEETATPDAATASSSAASSATVSALTKTEEATAKQTLIKNKEKTKQRAYSYLLNSIAPRQLELFQEADTPWEVWRTLRRIYANRSQQNVFLLMQELINAKMSDSQKVTEHLAHIRTIVGKIRDIATFDDTIAIVVLLNSLPKDYESLVVALLSSDTNLTWDLVASRIRQEELRINMKASETNTSSASGYYTDSRQRKPKGGSKKNQPKANQKEGCPGCQKDGTQHWKSCQKQPQPPKSGYVASIKKEPCTEKYAFVTGQNTPDTPESGRWILDSGASDHMVNDDKKLKNYCKLKKFVKVHLGDNHIVDAVGVGTLLLYSGTKGIELKKVYHVPSLSVNLISVSMLDSNKFSLTFANGVCKIADSTNTVVAMAKESYGLYELLIGDVAQSNLFSYVANTSYELWHNRLGHISSGRMNIMKKRNLISFTPPKEGNSLCESCLYGKFTRSPFPPSLNKAANPLELIHADICGPLEVESLSKCRYILTIVDDCSSFFFVSTIKNKDDAAESLKFFIQHFERKLSKQVVSLRSDNGREFLSSALSLFLSYKGIEQQLTVPYNPEQNGVAERANRTLLESARAMLLHSGLPKFLWAEAVHAACCIYNN